MIINPYIFTVAGFDSDAQAFFTAASITDNTQKTAINQLVLDLKSYSLWTKFIAIYPLVGGSATSHKYNLKNPVDSDAAFRLVFSGGITHDANGITGNGTTGYADTKIIPSTNFSLDDCSGFSYSRTNSSGAYVDFGVINASAPFYRFQLNPRNASNNFTSGCNDNTVSSVANSDSRGLFGITRTSSGSYDQSFNSTQTAISVTSTGRNTNFVSLMAHNQVGTIINYSPRNLAFAAFGSGLSAAECDNLYTAVQAYQTTLSRNV